jgi:hypothetical protein
MEKSPQDSSQRLQSFGDEFTRISADVEKKTSAPQPRMDGGVVCWMQVVGSFCMWANSWGVINSFGVSSTLNPKY